MSCVAMASQASSRNALMITPKVRAVIDDNSNISAKVMPANALCTVEGDLNLYDSGYLLVENIDKDANVSIGDKVVTSPISDLYHSGLIIGYVAKTSYDTNNLTMTAYITPQLIFKHHRCACHYGRKKGPSPTSKQM